MSLVLTLSPARRRALAGCAVALLAATSLSACIHLPRLPGPHSGGKGYQGTGTRIPVLTLNQQLQPAAALKGVDFTTAPAQPRTDWPNPGGTPEQSVDHVAAAPNFEVAWRRRIGDPTNRRGHVTSTPVAAEGMIFTLDGQATVSAHDQKTGAEAWRVNLAPRRGRDREAYGGGVAYADGTVFVSSGFRLVTALDSKTGKVKWRTAMTSPMHGAPTVAGGRVFAIDIQDQLFALDAATGTIVWNFQALEEPARVLAASSPAVSGDVVVAPFASGEVVALRAANGNMLWSDTLSFTSRNNALSEIRDIAGRPVIYRDSVFAGSHSGLFASLSLREGQRQWELPIATITTPLPTGDVVYVVDQGGQLICIARESGQVFWAVDLDAGIKKRNKRPIWSGPLLVSDRLVVVNSHGEAVTLNPKTGAKMKTLRIGSPAVVAPIAVNGMIYVVTDKAELVAIR